MKPPSFSPYRAFGKSCTSFSTYTYICIPFPPPKTFLLRWYRHTAGRPTWMMFMSSPEAQGCPWNACHSRSSFCCVLAKCMASFSKSGIVCCGDHTRIYSSITVAPCDSFLPRSSEYPGDSVFAHACFVELGELLVQVMKSVDESKSLRSCFVRASSAVSLVIVPRGKFFQAGSNAGKSLLFSGPPCPWSRTARCWHSCRCQFFFCCRTLCRDHRQPIPLCRGTCRGHNFNFSSHLKVFPVKLQCNAESVSLVRDLVGPLRFNV